MRPSHLLPAVGLRFGLFLLAPLARGDSQPRPKLPVPAPDPKAPAPVTLPVTRIVLFNAGIGYFHREGDVTGDGRLDLRFAEADVNDLLKSLVLTDKDGGKVRAVTYDNRLPVDITLKTFAVDVTENPTVGQLMHQVRGEKVEVADKTGVVTVGQIVSVERPAPPPMGVDPGELLNLLTDDGLQTVELKQAKKIRFVRPELQAEFRKALELLASARGDNKKAVSVVFSGNGKRRVGVGYVTEAPLWKPSYRLSVDEKGAARLQGWATVENTTDEDWTNVKVGLVAGRPMTFQMDLYDPLFVPRPTVESELFASLRPPLYQGGMNPAGNIGAGMVMNPGAGAAGMPGQGANPFFGMQGGIGFGGGMMGIGGIGGNPVQGGFGGNPLQGGGQGGGIQGGQPGFGYPAVSPYPPRVPRPDLRTLYGQRLSYDEYLNRLRGKPTPPPEEAAPAPKTVRDPLDKEAGALAAAEGGLGDMFEYTIEEPVTLPRQKSALLPIANEPVEVSRVTIYNVQVLGKHPLLGLKLLNKTKLHLAQGPVAVYDGGTFAGDARLPDLKPNETRLVSYAIDLGTEVVARDGGEKSALLAVGANAGRLQARVQHKYTTKYLIRNRNPQDRTVLVEHPILPGRKLIAPEKPADRTRDFYRFEVAVKPGDLVTLEVAEEAEDGLSLELASAAPGSLLYYAKHAGTKPAVREVIARVLDARGKLADTQKGIETEQAALKEIADDQERMRKNIERVPKDSDAYKRYLKKFDEQETEIEKRQARVKELKAELAKQEQALKEYAEAAKAE
ncbi:MAG: hypothetical protein JWO38_5473 [Gemmataceae bacterium]|nr:hypothetical protein [Gemmataceae bacterium]